MPQDLDAEKSWYTKPRGDSNHWLMCWPWVHPARQERAWAIGRRNTRRVLLDTLGSDPVARALVAPCGTDGDQDILNGMALEWHGIDISPDALATCRKSHPDMALREGDITASGYEAEYFDLVASLLVFHHLHRVGFDGFLREFSRVLRPGGILAILEPSSLSPWSIATTVGHKLFGNPSGLVPDEAPIRPSRLTSAIEGAGFEVERFEGVSYTHNRLPVPAQRAVEVISRPFTRSLPAIAWLCVWVSRKR